MEPLGEGGHGTTFRGVDRATHRNVAIKVLSLKGQQDWKSFDLFEREVAVLKSLDHPRIPKYIDSYASEDTGDFFLVMSLVEGMPLSDYIKRSRRLPPGGLRRLLDEGLDVLQYLHGLSPPVVHRDIKPGNLLLSPKGELWVVDFGGVRLAVGTGGGSTMIGTFGYMAPEQLHGEITCAVDIFALGATLAAVHCGQEADALPHDGLHLDIASMELPEDLRDVVAQMVEPDPRLRLGSVAAVREALKPRRKRLVPPAAVDTVVSKARRAPVPHGDRETSLDIRTEIPAAMQAVAGVPFPLSFLVWMLSAIASGTLIVFEVLLLPLIAMVAVALNERSKKPEQREKLDGHVTEMRDTVVATRRAFAWLAEQTSPVRGRDDASRPD